MMAHNEQKVPQSGTAVNNEVVDSRRAATMMGFKEQTLRKMRLSGNGPPYIKINRSIRYRVRAVQDWLAERETCAPTGGGS